MKTYKERLKASCAENGQASTAFGEIKKYNEEFLGKYKGITDVSFKQEDLKNCFDLYTYFSGQDNEKFFTDFPFVSPKDIAEMFFSEWGGLPEIMIIGNECLNTAAYENAMAIYDMFSDAAKDVVEKLVEYIGGYSQFERIISYTVNGEDVSVITVAAGNRESTTILPAIVDFMTNNGFMILSIRTGESDENIVHNGFAFDEEGMRVLNKNELENAMPDDHKGKCAKAFIKF